MIALLIAACLLIRRKRRNDLDAKDQIRWPELAATAEDRAALYPETTHRTGRAGVGEDGDMEQLDGASVYGGAAGAGMAGLGAAGAPRYGSQAGSHGRQPTLPQIAPSIYSEDGGQGAYGQSVYSGQSHAPTYMTHGTNNAGLGAAAGAAPGPASIDYYARHNQTPSPPRTYAEGSSSGHDGAGMAGVGSDPYAQEHHQPEIERAASPTPMQVGGAFGQGYDESEGGKRWRLSVVNDDGRKD